MPASLHRMFPELRFSFLIAPRVQSAAPPSSSKSRSVRTLYGILLVRTLPGHYVRTLSGLLLLLPQVSRNPPPPAGTRTGAPAISNRPPPRACTSPPRAPAQACTRAHSGPREGRRGSARTRARFCAWKGGGCAACACVHLGGVRVRVYLPLLVYLGAAGVRVCACAPRVCVCTSVTAAPWYACACVHLGGDAEERHDQAVHAGGRQVPADPHVISIPDPSQRTLVRAESGPQSALGTSRTRDRARATPQPGPAPVGLGSGPAPVGLWPQINPLACPCE